MASNKMVGLAHVKRRNNGIEPIFTDKKYYKTWWIVVYDLEVSKHFGTYEELV